MLVRPDNLPHVGRQFEAMVVWMAEQPLVPGKPYTLKHTTRRWRRHGQHAALRHRRQHAAPAGSPHAGAERDRPLPRCGSTSRWRSTPTARNAGTGAFILIDRLTNNTVGAGMILDRAAAEAHGDHWDDGAGSAACKAREST